MSSTKYDLMMNKLRLQYENKGANKQEAETQASKEISQEENYDDLNWYDKLNAGVMRVQKNVGKGFFGAFEGISDFALTTAAKVTGAFGNNSASDTLLEIAKKNTTEEFFESDLMDKYYKIAGLSNIVSNFSESGRDKLNKTIDYSKSNESLPSIVDKASTTIGNAAGFYALAGGSSNIGGAIGSKLGSGSQVAAKIGSSVGQNLTMFQSAMGSSTVEALKEGNNLDRSLAYGALSGATEVVSEALVGNMIDKVGGAFKGGAKAAFGSSSFNGYGGTKGTSFVATLLKDFNEEGAEEVFSDLVDPISRMLTIDNGKYEGNFFQQYGNIFQDNGGVQSVVESYLLGGLGGAFMGGARMTSSVAEFSDKGLDRKGLVYTKIQAYENQIAEINKEKYSLMDKNSNGSNDARIEALNEQIKTIQDKIQTDFGDVLKQLQEQYDTATKEKDIYAQINDLNNRLNEDITKAEKLEIKQKINDLEKMSKRLDVVSNFDAEANRNVAMELAQDTVKEVGLKNTETYSKNVNSEADLKNNKLGFAVADVNKVETKNIDGKNVQVVDTKNASKNLLKKISHEILHIANRTGKANIVDSILKDYKKNNNSEYKQEYDKILKLYENEYTTDAIKNTSYYENNLKTMSETEAVNKALESMIDEEIAANKVGELFKNVYEFKKAIKTANRTSLLNFKKLVNKLWGKGSKRKKPQNYYEVVAELNKGIQASEELAIKEYNDKLESPAKDTRFYFEDLETKRQDLFVQKNDGWYIRKGRNSNSLTKLKPGDVISLDYYNDDINRIKSKNGKGYINALSTNAGHWAYVDFDNEIQVLQPSDYWKLQGFKMGDLQKVYDALPKTSASAIYRATGNSMTKQVMQSVLGKLNLPKDVKIIEVFGGIGASRMALRDLGHNVTTLDYREILQNSIDIYNAVNGENFEAKDIKLPMDITEQSDVLIHGSPCVDFSKNKHNRQGAKKGSNTESALMWETIDRLYELKEKGVLPKIVIWENVADVQYKKFQEEFNMYIKEMEKLGYAHNEHAILNSINFGVPQTRHRSFVVSSLENINYKFDFGSEQNAPDLVKFLKNKNSAKNYDPNKKDIRFSITTDSEGNELTQEQKDLFKDSKVVDDDGNLLVVYHGTMEDFTVFDKSKGRTSSDFYGSYFSPYEIEAQGYGTKVGQYYLNITNPADEKTAMKVWYKYKGQNNAGVKATNELAKMGYDGIIMYDEIIAFEPEQIKLTSNKTPTTSSDIRYSIATDSEGNKLSYEQEEYFKDSKIIDENGNLLVVYKGSRNAGRMTFKQAFTYFASSRRAETYGWNDNLVKTKKFESIDEAIDWWYEEGDDMVSPYPFDLVTRDQFNESELKDSTVAVLTKNNKIVEEYSSLEELNNSLLKTIQEFVNKNTFNEKSKKTSLYKGYVNIKNPLVIDAKGRDFEHVMYNGKFMLTDDIAELVKKEGKYDGIIFKNIYDEGDTETRHVEDEYVIFNSNQFKSYDNYNPTNNEDIRYSLEDDIENVQVKIEENRKTINSLSNTYFNALKSKTISADSPYSYVKEATKQVEEIKKNIKKLESYNDKRTLDYIDESKAFIEKTEERISKIKEIILDNENAAKESHSLKGYEKAKYLEIISNKSNEIQLLTSQLAESKEYLSKYAHIIKKYKKVASEYITNPQQETLNREKYENLMSDYNKLKANTDYLEDKLVKYNNRYKKSLNNWKTKYKEGKATIKQLEKTLSSYVQEIEYLYDENMAASKTNVSLRKLVSNLSQKVVDYEKQVKKLKIDYEENKRLARVEKNLLKYKDAFLRTRNENRTGVAFESNVVGLLRSISDMLNYKVGSKKYIDNKVIDNVYKQLTNNNFDVSEIADYYMESLLETEVEENVTLAEKLDSIDIDNEKYIEELKSDLISIFKNARNGESLSTVGHLKDKINEIYRKNKTKNSISKLQNGIRRFKKAFTKLDTANKLGAINNKEIVEAYNELRKSFKGITNIESIQNGDIKKTILDFYDKYNNIINDLNKKNVDTSDIKLNTELESLFEELSSSTETDNKEMDLCYKILVGTKRIGKVTIKNNLSQYLNNLANNGIYNIGDISGTQHALRNRAINEFENFVVDKWNPGYAVLAPRVVFGMMASQNKNTVWYQFYKELEKGQTKMQYSYVDMYGKYLDFTKTKEGKRVMKELAKKGDKSKITIKYGNTSITARASQLLSLYELSKREHAYEHLEKNGYTLETHDVTKFENQEEIKDLIDGIEKHFDLANSNSDYAKYLKFVEDFFEKAKEYKITTDKSVRGFTNVVEGFYFPISVSKFNFDSKVATLGDINVDNMQGALSQSFNKDVISNGGALMLKDIEKVVENHAKQMSIYVGYAQPLNTFIRLYNGRVENGNTLNATIQNKYGKDGAKVENYLNSLFKDIQLIDNTLSNTDTAAKKIENKLRNNIASVTLFINPKVWFSQLSSIPGAMKYIKASNIVKGTKNFVGTANDIPEIPLNARYRNIDKTALQAETLGAKLNVPAETMGKVITKFDGLAMNVIWAASCYQSGVMNYKKGTIEYEVAYNKANELFTTTVNETQPNFNPLGRSELMRTKDPLVKLFTMFKSQNQQNLSNFVEAFSKIRNGKNSDEAIAALVALLLQGLLYTFIGEVSKHVKANDWESEDFGSTLAKDFGIDFVNQNILGMFPIIDNFKVDLESKYKFKVNEFSAGWLDTILESFNNLADGNATPKDMVETFSYLTGYPVSALATLVKNITQYVAPEYAYTYDMKYKGKSTSTKQSIDTAMKTSKAKGESAYKVYTNNIMQVSDRVMKEMYSLYGKGYKDVAYRQIPTTITVNGVEKEIDTKLFKDIYSMSNKKLENLMNSVRYANMDSEQRANIVKYILDMYYSLARKKCIDSDLSFKENVLYLGYNLTNKQLLELYKITTIDGDAKSTKKEKIQKYINSLNTSKGEKYFLYMMAGYSITDDKLEIVKKYLISQGMSYTNVKKILGV